MACSLEPVGFSIYSYFCLMNDELFDPIENFKKGYVKIFRSFMDHYLFQNKEPFSRREAWLYIMLNANHDVKPIRIKNTSFIVNRGETIRSLDTLANDWRWDKSKVRRFLEMLQKENMIVLINEQKATRIIVCKYDTYQSFGNTDETQMKREKNGSKPKSTPNKEAKNRIDSKIDITERRKLFIEELRKFENLYSIEMRNSFYAHWAELNTDKTKMKFEMETTWELDLRLIKWKNNGYGNVAVNVLPDRGALKIIDTFEKNKIRK